MKTIPENPKPGERYARFQPHVNLWSVHEPGGAAVVASHVSEADARLLVCGLQAVEALRHIEAALALTDAAGHPIPLRIWNAVGESRAALDHFPQGVKS